MNIGDIVVALKPMFPFEHYEGTIVSIDGSAIGVKWVYDEKGNVLEYGIDELRHIS